MLNSDDYMKIFHEIKNSVTLVSSYLQLVQKNHSEITEFDYWSDSISEVTRLRTVVTELSQVRLGDGLKLETIDIRTFISDICDSYRSIGGEDDFVFKVSHPSEPLPVLIDPMQLRHAFLNLIKNSCEAMNHTGTICVDTGLSEQQVYVKITDFGGGLAPEIANQIFDPFITTKEDGSGLGLIIVRQIVEAHNGSVHCESRPEDGCTFYIYLPC